MLIATILVALAQIGVITLIVGELSRIKLIETLGLGMILVTGGGVLLALTIAMWIEALN